MIKVLERLGIHNKGDFQQTLKNHQPEQRGTQSIAPEIRNNTKDIVSKVIATPVKHLKDTKWIEMGKEEVRMSLFPYVCKVAGYKIHTQNVVYK